jgi:AcrR family transcriptional regulator
MMRDDRTRRTSRLPRREAVRNLDTVARTRNRHPQRSADEPTSAVSDLKRAGHPRGAAELRPGVTAAIADSALDELAEVGYGRLTMEAVARRAGVGKAALYRRWSSKQEMTIDIVSGTSVDLAEAPDCGTLYADVRAMLQAIIQWLEDPRTGRIMPDLIAEARRNPGLADALTDQIGIPRRARVAAIFDRALERGQVREDAERDVFLDVIAGIVYWHVVVRRIGATPAYLDLVAQLIVRTLSVRDHG